MENLPTNSYMALLRIIMLFESLAVFAMHKNDRGTKISSPPEAANVSSSGILMAKRLGTSMMLRTMSSLRVSTSSSLKNSSLVFKFQHKHLHLLLSSSLLLLTGIHRNIPHHLLLYQSLNPILPSHQPLFLLLHLFP